VTTNDEEAPPTKHFKDSDYVDNDEEEETAIEAACMVTKAEAPARRRRE
jgi:hypothetical protein